MHSIARAFAVAVVFVGACVAWITLGAIMSHRSTDQKNTLESRVNDLWGRPHVQRAPVFTFRADADEARPNALGSVPAPAAWATSPQVASPRSASAEPDTSRQDLPAPAAPVASLRPASSRIGVDLDLDARQKGLTWYALYDVGFDGAWVYRHESDEAGTLTVGFAFPDPNGVYDGFRFEVNGAAVDAQPSGGGVVTEIPVVPGDEITVHAAYQSRGLDEWRYAPSDGAGSLRDFELVMRTDFDAVDFPSQTLSPSERRAAEGGEELVWRFEQVVSGYGIGMVMPQRLQPGELASELAFSAPISLLFFFLIIGVLARLRALDVHPINYFFLAAAFFSFHLLFAYTADHLPVWVAFGLASAVSVAMVVTYLRLVVSRRFAFFEAGIAQLVYLVGFSLAHFAKGFTGVTVTVLSIATLFVLMLLTGRIRWSTVLDAKLGAPPPPAGVGNGPMGAPVAHAYAEAPRPA